MPWLKVRDVPSRGTSSGVQGIKVQRPYHFLSQYETTYFYLVERSPHTVDIREQWPILDISRTLELCAEAGVRHAYKGMYPEPFTIDFVITEKRGDELFHRAASIKPPDELSDPDVRRRLSIERRWCEERKLPWAAVDTTRFDVLLLENLRYVRGWYRHRFKPTASCASKFAHTFMLDYRPDMPLSYLLSQTARKLAFSDNFTADLFRYCAWAGMVPISLRHKISNDRPLVLLSEVPYAGF